MKISIITITYNSAKTVQRALASVQGQTYAEIEHIIVDGASTDGTKEVIESYAKQHPEKFFLVTRVGCGIAGFTDEEMAPLFREAQHLTNIALPQEWQQIVYNQLTI